MNTEITIYSERGNDDFLEIYDRDGFVYISIDNTWAGCSETGFGRTTSVVFNKKNAETLRDRLNNFLNNFEVVK